MSNILDIPQIPITAIELLQNDLHIGFTGDISKRLQKARWTTDIPPLNVFPVCVDQLMGAFITAQANEDRVYVLTQGSELTGRRQDRDRQRDAVYKEVRKAVDTFATLTIFPDKQQMALLMQACMQKYAINPDGGIEAQTIATDQWLQEQLQNIELQQAAVGLGLHESIQQLKELNDEIQQLTADRNDERAQKATAELKQARTATDQAYRELVTMLNAQAIVTNYDAASAELNTKYCELIRSTQETIRYYRQLSDDRRRANKRVAVKSDITGNHTYATVAGWTWERLIQDGKAALAVDDDNPDRILSTDKKALKAGGLMLALGGVAVKPSDDVDAEQEYALVPVV